MTITLHPLARITPRTRAELQAEDARLVDAELTQRYGITPPTTRKWRQREDAADRSHRPHTRHCAMTTDQEATAMVIRETLWLPLDDPLMGSSIPKVSRSSLMHCLTRHGLNRHPAEDKDAPKPPIWLLSAPRLHQAQVLPENPWLHPAQPVKA